MILELCISTQRQIQIRSMNKTELIVVFDYFECLSIGNYSKPEYECRVEQFVMQDLSQAFPYMRRASLTAQLFFSFYSFFFTLIGIFLKIFIFAFLSSPTETSSSINLMIFMQQICRIAMSFYYLWFSFAYLLPFSLQDIMGGNFCTWFSAVGTGSLFGDLFWSSALAFTRYVYIKRSRWLR